MTEKRFHYQSDGYGYYYICDGGKSEDKIFAEIGGDVEEVTDKLNSLSEENEQLKLQLRNISDQRDEFFRGARENANRVGKLEKENEQLKQFQTNVFTLINEMIETSNIYRTPIRLLDYGDDLGFWNGLYQTLKELRDILENEETRR